MLSVGIALQIKTVVLMNSELEIWKQEVVT